MIKILLSLDDSVKSEHSDKIYDYIDEYLRMSIYTCHYKLEKLMVVD